MPLGQDRASSSNASDQFQFGSFPATNGPSLDIPLRRIFGTLNASFQTHPCSSAQPDRQPMKPALKRGPSKILIQNRATSSDPLEIGEPVSCSRCLGLGHLSWACSSQIRCKSCFTYGHRARFCFTARPKKQCRPKVPTPEHGNQSPNLGNHANIPNSSPSLQSAPSSSESNLTENPSSPLTMANFQCNPQSYMPPGAHVEHGWQHPARSRIALGGEPPRHHEDYVIVVMEPAPPEAEVMDFLRDVVDQLEHDHPVRVQSFYRNPLWLGLV